MIWVEKADVVNDLVTELDDLVGKSSRLHILENERIYANMMVIIMHYYDQDVRSTTTKS